MTTAVYHASYDHSCNCQTLLKSLHCMVFTVDFNRFTLSLELCFSVKTDAGGDATGATDAPGVDIVVHVARQHHLLQHSHNSISN